MDDIGSRGLGARLRENRAIIIVVLLALALRVALFLLVRPWDSEVLTNTILVTDAAGYHKLALGILQSGSFATFGAFRTPVYPAFLSTVYSVLGIKPWVVLFLQLFISSATAVLVYAWAKLAVGRGAAIVAAAAFAVQPHTALYSVALMTDTLFVFAFFASVLALVHGLKTSKLALFIVSGALLGVATLIRPVTQYFPMVAAFLILIYRGATWQFRGRAFAVLALVFVLTLTPWLYRNHAEYGYVALSTIQGENLLFYGASYAEVARTGRTIEEVRAEFGEIATERGAIEGHNPFENSKIYQDIAMSYMKSNPVLYAKRHLRGIANMFLNLSTQQIGEYLGVQSRDLPYHFFAAPSFQETVRGFFRSKSPAELTIGAFVGVVMLATYLAALVGGCAVLRRRNHFYLMATVITALYFLASVGPIGQARYKMPLVPFYIAYTGLGLSEVWRFAKRRVWKRGPG
ncbi:glycosyltransferase family 39 protein [bacterium]|nr:glycosyltransferase family 39 protein [bacterium]